MKKNDDTLVTKKDLKEFGERLEFRWDSKLDKKLNEMRDDMRQWHSDILDKVFGVVSS